MSSLPPVGGINRRGLFAVTAAQIVSPVEGRFAALTCYVGMVASRRPHRSSGADLHGCLSNCAPAAATARAAA